MAIWKFTLDVSTPLDVEYGIKCYGNKDIYFNLLKQYDKYLCDDLENAWKAINLKDFKKFKDSIHSIKGSSAYAGAGWVTDVCYYI